MVTLAVEDLYFSEIGKRTLAVVSPALVALLSASNTPIQLCRIKKQIVLIPVFLISVGPEVDTAGRLQH